MKCLVSLYLWELLLFLLRELRERFDLKQEEYSSYKDLKRRMIERACSEINSKSTMQVHFIEIKVGRHVGFVQFFIEDQRNNKDVNVALFEEGQQLGLSVEAMKTLIAEFPEKLIQKGLLVLKNSKKAVKNPLLFVKKAIKEEWQPFCKSGDVVSADEYFVVQTEISLLKEHDICIQIRRRFLEREGISEYKGWIQPLRFFMEGETVVVLVKTQFIKDWLETKNARIFRDYADGRKVVFRIEDEAVAPLVDKSLAQKSLRKTKAVESVDVPVLPEEVVKDMRVISESKKKKSVHRKQVITPEKPLEIAKKKSLWERIIGFWR